MDIKKYMVISFVIVLTTINLLFLVSFWSRSTMSSNADNTGERDYNNNNIKDNEPRLKTSDIELTDKVYTFLAPGDTWTFNNYFEEDYNYLIYIELVTPHNASKMRITILDPEDKLYNIFESKMFFNPEYGRYFEIPFGTVKTGLHNLTFYSNSQYNFNMHILIRQGLKCLNDKISQEDADNLLAREVDRFDNNKDRQYNVKFKTDEMHKIYLGRVSAITIVENNEVYVDLKIEAPDQENPSNKIEFIIYTDELLANIEGVSGFNFGTAVEGTYTIDLTVRCSVAHVNIALAIVDDYVIGDAESLNTTRSDVKESESEDDEIDMLEVLENNLMSLPAEWTIGTLLSVAGLAGLMTIILIRHKQSNAVSLSTRKK